jgi:hypothetical protein
MPARKTLKNKIHWQAVPQHALANTVWSTANTETSTPESMAIDVNEFESLFCRTDAPAKSTTSGGRGGGGRLKKKSGGSKAKSSGGGSFLDMRRANNVSIGVGRFQKLVPGFEGLRMAVVTMDEAVFDLDDLYLLQVFIYLDLFIAACFLDLLSPPRRACPPVSRSYALSKCCSPCLLCT